EIQKSNLVSLVVLLLPSSLTIKTIKASLSKAPKNSSTKYATCRQTFEWMTYAACISMAAEAQLLKLDIMKSQSRCTKLNTECRAAEAKERVIKMELDVKTKENKYFQALDHDKHLQALQKATDDYKLERTCLEHALVQANNKTLDLQNQLIAQEAQVKKAKCQSRRS
ncbi:hypothetical protein FRC09_007063, partial [Ceratobasidium sp. 395]